MAWGDGDILIGMVAGMRKYGMENSQRIDQEGDKNLEVKNLNNLLKIN